MTTATYRVCTMLQRLHKTHTYTDHSPCLPHSIKYVAPQHRSPAQRNVLVRSTQGDPNPDYSAEAFLGAFKQSNLINSEIYLNELEMLQKKQETIADFLPKFWSMDVTGKRIFVQMLDEFLNSYSVHLGRLKLMKDDPAAEKMLGLLNRQLLAAQVDVDTFYSSLSRQAEQFRELTDMEERALANPMEHARVRKYIQSLTAPPGSINIKDILEANPSLAEAFTDPDAMVMIKEVSEYAANINKWVDHGRLGPIAQLIRQQLRDAGVL